MSVFEEDFLDQIVGIHWGLKPGEILPNSILAYVITSAGDKVGSAYARGYTYPYGSPNSSAGVGGPGGWTPITTLKIPYHTGKGGYFGDVGGVPDKKSSFVPVMWYYNAGTSISNAGGFYTNFDDISRIIEFNAAPSIDINDLSWTAVAILPISLP